MQLYCNKCNNVFYQTWSDIKQGHGCKQCAIKKNSEIRKKISFTDVVNMFSEKGLDVLSLEEEYKNTDSVIKYRCICGTESSNKYHNILKGQQCRNCGYMKNSKTRKISEEYANELVKKQNLQLQDYLFDNMKTPANLKCNICSYLFQRPLRSVKWKNSGCPNCNSSSGERLLMNILIHNKISFIQQYKFEHDPLSGQLGCIDKNNLPFDILLQPFDGHEMLIEIDGIQHFHINEFFGGCDAFIKRREHDIIKSLYCYNNNVPLLRIHYTDFDKMEELIDIFINNYRHNKPKNTLMYSDPLKYEDLIAQINETNN